MLIERTPRQMSSRVHIQLVFWRFYFAFWLDRKSIGLGLGFYNINQDFRDPIFPRKNNFWADNSFKGRLQRMYHDYTK